MAEGEARAGEARANPTAEPFSPRPLPAAYRDLEETLRKLTDFRFGRAIATTSSLPGGQYAHRFVEKVARRQTEALLQQAQMHADDVNRALVLLTEIVVQQLDDLQDGLAELQRTVNRLQHAPEVR
ncbi:MAG: hypothetical protein ACRDV7_05905 [Acidimicrobiia bacterium]